MRLDHRDEAETRVSTLASWGSGDAEAQLSSLASMLRRGFQPSHLGAVLVACVSGLCFLMTYPQ